MRSKLLLATVLAIVVATGCGSSSQPGTEKTAARDDEAPPPAKDDTALLPDSGRTGARVVPNHLLDIRALPGGTIGEYETGGKKYQLFIIETDSNQKAAFLITDLRDALKSPEYISYMGGYFGDRKGTPIYGFAKLRYVAGVVGLSKDEADPLARQLAARLK